MEYKLEDLFTLQMGKTPSRNNFEYWDSPDNKWISISDLSRCDKYIINTKECISDKAVEESGISLIPENTVIMSFKLSIGKVAITAEPMYSNEAIMSFRDRHIVELLPDYVYYMLMGQNWEKGTNKAVMGRTLNKATLSQIKVCIHAIETQYKIVATLDTLQSIITHRKQQLAKLDELVKARFVEMFGDITDTVPLSHYIKALTAGKSLAGEEKCKNKVLKTGAATYDYFDSTQVKNLPIDYTPLSEHQIHDGDVIISRMNTAELVGAAAYIWKAPDNTYLPDRLWRAELKDNVNPIFVWQIIIQSTTKDAIKRIAGGTSGSMKNISKPALLGLNVIKASLEIQNQFANFVEQTEKSKVAVQKALDEAQLLFDSLMQEYFG